jgi:F-type H+-transporting ATPase subunit b
MLHTVNVVAAEEAHNPLFPAAPDLIWASVCFIVILVFFWKIALPRMQKMLDERGEAIEGNIAKADAAQHEAEGLLEEYTAQLADARTEAANIRDQAREDGKRILAEQKEQAATEAARITATAHSQIEAERHAAAVSLRSEVGSIALDLASGVIGESLTDDKKAAGIVDRFLADLEASEAGSADKAGSTT